MCRIFQTTELIFFYLIIAAELAVVCRGQPRSIRKCHAEFTELFRGKLWSLLTMPLIESNLEVSTCTGMLGIWQILRDIHGNGYRCCGNTAGLQLRIVRLLWGWISLGWTTVCTWFK